MNKILFILILFYSLGFSKLPIPTGNLSGLVYDAQSGDSLSWVNIYIDELQRSGSTDKGGRYFIPNIPAGEYTLHITRIGYLENHLHVDVDATKNNTVNIALFPQWMESETIVVEDHRKHSHLQEPDIEIGGKKLRRNLGTTLAETIKGEPGLDLQTNGPAPARPVLRGLSGDRLLLLENGERTGDLSNSASDHAVTIEPLNAKRIEVVRGPKTLIYGANTLSGIINVINNQTKQAQEISGHFDMNGESVNNGYSSSANVQFPVSNFTFGLDGSYRKADNINTPIGNLKNTFINTKTARGQLDWYPSWGIFSSSLGIYDSNYGIPPAPEGLGHENGVDINMNKNTFETGITLFNLNNWLKKAQINYDRKRYFHEELANNSQDAAFELLTQHVKISFDFNDFFLSENITAGFWMEHRDYKSGGRTNTVNTVEKSFAGFLYQENNFGDFKTSAAIRVEHKNIQPEEEKIDLRVGHIRKRNFFESAFSLKAEYGVSKKWILGLNLIKAFRAPGIEELMSDGPHLASYAYEIGNADLKPENTYGVELNADYKGKGLILSGSAYYNRIDGYLFSQATGDTSWRRNDLLVYKMVGLDAVIKGVELTANLDLLPSLSLSGSASYLHGDLQENYRNFDDDGVEKSVIVKTKEPLPFMPPLKMDIAAEYKLSSYNFTYSISVAAKQDRLAKFETATNGYFVHNLGAEFFISSEIGLHSFYLNINNIFNTEYRRHLNRIKDIFPEAGRNIRLSYKLFF